MGSETAERKGQSEQQQPKPIPVYDETAPALTPEHALYWEGIPLREIIGGEHFLFQIRNDSIASLGIHDGHLAYIRKQSAVDEGDVAVVKVLGRAGMFLCQVHRRGDRIFLTHDRTGLEDYPPEKVEILGKMLWVLYYPKPPKGGV